MQVWWTKYLTQDNTQGT